MTRVLLLTFVFGLAIGAVGTAQTSQMLEGVWQTVEVTGPSGTNKTPQPGLYIFTKKHYSIVEDTGVAERPALTVDETSSIGDVTAVFGPFQSLAGPYQAANGKITFGVMISKNPRLMKAVIPRTGTYSIANGLLTITQGTLTRKLKRLE